VLDLSKVYLVVMTEDHPSNSRSASAYLAELDDPKLSPVIYCDDGRGFGSCSGSVLSTEGHLLSSGADLRVAHADEPTVDGSVPEDPLGNDVFLPLPEPCLAGAWLAFSPGGTRYHECAGKWHREDATRIDSDEISAYLLHDEGTYLGPVAAPPPAEVAASIVKPGSANVTVTLAPNASDPERLTRRKVYTGRAVADGFLLVVTDSVLDPILKIEKSVPAKTLWKVTLDGTATRVGNYPAGASGRLDGDGRMWRIQALKVLRYEVGLSDPVEVATVPESVVGFLLPHRP
jgi:hypothetical protein